MNSFEQGRDIIRFLINNSMSVECIKEKRVEVVSRVEFVALTKVIAL